MKMDQGFISGYASAVSDLGQEGDHRISDWSLPYEYLKSRLATFEPIGRDIVDQLRSRGEFYNQAADEIVKLRGLLAQTAEFKSLREIAAIERPRDIHPQTQHRAMRRAFDKAQSIAVAALKSADGAAPSDTSHKRGGS